MFRLVKRLISWVDKDLKIKYFSFVEACSSSYYFVINQIQQSVKWTELFEILFFT